MLDLDTNRHGILEILVGPGLPLLVHPRFLIVVLGGGVWTPGHIPLRWVGAAGVQHSSKVLYLPRIFKDSPRNPEGVHKDSLKFP